MEVVLASAAGVQARAFSWILLYYGGQGRLWRAATTRLDKEESKKQASSLTNRNKNHEVGRGAVEKGGRPGARDEGPLSENVSLFGPGPIRRAEAVT